MSGAGIGSKPSVQVNGTALADTYANELMSLVIDNHLHLPDMFALHFHDADRTLLSKTGITFGSSITVQATRTAGDGSMETIIEGEVTAIEAELSGKGGSTTIVRGYDKAHRMARGLTTATYKNIKDSDIATKLAQQDGLEIGKIDATDTVYDQVGQVNTSNMDFLKARASLIGYQCYVAEGKFNFCKPDPATSAPQPTDDVDSTNRLQLVLGDTLISFRPRASSNGQVSKVSVTGWDPKTKQTVTGQADAGADHAQVGVTPAAMADKFGSGSTHTVVDSGVTTSSDANAAAAAAAKSIGSTAIEAEGVAVGDPKLKAGVAISVGKVGDPFDGQYTLTTTRHVYGREGYRTHFVVSGVQERSLLGLVTLGANTPSAGKGGKPIYGVVVGIVTNIDDPDKSARVKLKFPWLSDDYESDWARLMMLGAGGERGALWLPEVGDEVLCAFEHGDAQTPFVIGSLYNGKDQPKDADKAVTGGQGAQRTLTSRKGHQLVFDEDKGITLATGDQSASLNFDTSNQGKITVKANGDIEITGQTKLSITIQQQDVEITASMGAIKLNATDIELNASAQLKLAGSATTQISGGVVQIN